MFLNSKFVEMCEAASYTYESFAEASGLWVWDVRALAAADARPSAKMFAAVRRTLGCKTKDLDDGQPDDRRLVSEVASEAYTKALVAAMRPMTERQAARISSLMFGTPIPAKHLEPEPTPSIEQVWEVIGPLVEAMMKDHRPRKPKK